ncbi:hypothetical protein [Aliiglaciecola lipolytica]|uniref:Uncharacterized protein n=1 Tax=Aliiglaciecola lipolytica E3 TaxID=1127673 RepID=K6YHM7_9ALTE|nr:hypothetical protein [Aliiglaciecola lipolytica]GAC16128.1 hypothetical protein GLIP_3515 [Aliiglaciecola lipolytica E3]
MQNSVVTMLILSAVITSPLALAKPDREGRGGKPPPEAFEACEGKSEGDEVSFTTPRGDNITASCKTMQNELVAVPEGHEQRKTENN